MDNTQTRRNFLKGAGAATASACGLGGCGAGGIFGDAGDECEDKINEAIGRYGKPEQVYSHSWDDGSWSKDLWWYSKGLCLGFQVYKRSSGYSCSTDSYTFRPY